MEYDSINIDYFHRNEARNSVQRFKETKLDYNIDFVYCICCFLCTKRLLPFS